MKNQHLENPVQWYLRGIKWLRVGWRAVQLRNEWDIYRRAEESVCFFKTLLVYSRRDKLRNLLWSNSDHNFKLNRKNYSQSREREIAKGKRKLKAMRCSLWHVSYAGIVNYPITVVFCRLPCHKVGNWDSPPPPFRLLLLPFVSPLPVSQSATHSNRQAGRATLGHAKRRYGGGGAEVENNGIIMRGKLRNRKSVIGTKWKRNKIMVVLANVFVLCLNRCYPGWGGGGVVGGS